MASIMEGPLSKWTNVMKGWQYRWFVLDYNAGLLSYYTGAVIGIDDEDDSTFTITVDQKTFHFQATRAESFAVHPTTVTPVQQGPAPLSEQPPLLLQQHWQLGGKVMHRGPLSSRSLTSFTLSPLHPHASISLLTATLPTGHPPPPPPCPHPLLCSDTVWCGSTIGRVR
ncbi:hypothetical protein JZ751_024746 [Albula glossodonta]|uniref:Uncharacterized protein n=1 Tax=Albula glossodonta TaxID=121402 RepID=A0A8T2PMG3_9TELE|nr:hypothetical protein JZ751_024746 [Albula glossodonta]